MMFCAEPVRGEQHLRDGGDRFSNLENSQKAWLKVYSVGDWTVLRMGNLVSSGHLARV